MTISIGSSFGPYRVVEPLGKGGMAAVFKVYEASLDRHLALKVLPSEFLHEEAFAERFRQEAKVIARLEHPNIIPIHAFGIEQGIPWMVMRLVSAGTLSHLLQAGRMANDRALAILSGAAKALDYAHEKGVVHRDVKPQNILLDEADRVYLADFGIAKLVEGAAVATRTGMIAGTPHYMAPEQALAKPVDHRADIYALGVVAYEIFTGRVPFTGDSAIGILMKHVSEPVPMPPPELLPPAVAEVLLRALTKNPDERWQTAGAFTEGLSSVLKRAETTTASPAAVLTESASPAPLAAAALSSPPPILAVTGRRSTVPWAVAGIVTVVVLGASALLFRSSPPDIPALTTTQPREAQGTLPTHPGQDARPPTAGLPAAAAAPRPSPRLESPPARKEPPPASEAPTVTRQADGFWDQHSSVSPAPAKTTPAPARQAVPGPEPAAASGQLRSAPLAFDRTLRFVSDRDLSLDAHIGAVNIHTVKFSTAEEPASVLRKLGRLTGGKDDKITLRSQFEMSCPKNAGPWRVRYTLDLIVESDESVGQLRKSESCRGEIKTVTIQKDIQRGVLSVLRNIRVTLEASPR